MRRLRRIRPSPATVIASLALLAALTGTSVAAVSIVLPRNSVGTPQLKNDAVTSKKVKNASLLSADFKTGQIPTGPAGATGAAGAAGAAGPTGPTGSSGPAGPSDAYSAFHDSAVSTSSPEATLISISVPQAGKYVLLGKAWFFNNSVGAVQMDCRLVAGGDFDQSRFLLHGNPNGSQAVPFMVVHEYGSAGNAQLRCNDFGVNVEAYDMKITAIKVGNLTNAGV